MEPMPENFDVEGLKHANKAAVAQLRERLLGLENLELLDSVGSSSRFESGTRSSTAPKSDADFLAHPSEYVVDMLGAGMSRAAVLERLVKAAELVADPGATVSILVLDKDGLLRNGASPNLPADYLHAINGLKPDSRVGTCAAAAATGCVVVTPDFCADNKWAELRHLPLALGYVGAWSVPIKAADGKVLGTFGTYFREHRTPGAAEQSAVQGLANAAALVLAKPEC